MGIWPWLANNWADFLATLFSGSGTWFAAYAIRENTKDRRASNVLAATIHHWEIWSDY
jgi:hypothetical protein